MNKYLSILRGINVSGQKKILMADLKALYEKVGLDEVTTYIQSGNVIFSSRLKSESRLKLKLEKAIEEKYGFHVPVLIKSSQEFARTLQQLPYKNIDLDKNGTKFLITFLSDVPAKDDIAALKEYVKSPEQLEVIGKSVFLDCAKGYGTSKLSNAFIEKKLNVTATTRNLKTVHTLNNLLHE